LNLAKRTEILAGMQVPMQGIDPQVAWRRGDTPAGEKVNYWAQPYEAYCDLLVAAISDLPAMFSSRYTWDIEPKRLREIVLRVANREPDNEDPEPLPDPKDDDCADLHTQVQQLKSALATAKAKAQEIANLG
jgi:hypothetical protein